MRDFLSSFSLPFLPVVFGELFVLLLESYIAECVGLPPPLTFLSFSKRDPSLFPVSLQKLSDRETGEKEKKEENALLSRKVNIWSEREIGGEAGI